MKREGRYRYAMASLFIISSVTALVEAYAHQKSVAEYTEVVQHATRVMDGLKNASKLLGTLTEAETGQRGYLLTGDPTYRIPFDHALTLTQIQLEEFRQTQPPERSRQVSEVEKVVGQKMVELKATIQAFDTQGSAAALSIVRTNRGEDAMTRLRIIIEQIIFEDNNANIWLPNEAAVKNANASAYWILFNFVVVAGLMAGLVGLWRASRKIEKLSSRLEHEARHDALTGMPNRASFGETLDYLLALAARDGRRIAVVFMDLDGFKAINDEFGHEVGDLALVEVAKALKGDLRQSDFAARFGGDEFVVIVPIAAEACDVCRRIEAAIASVAPIQFAGRRLGTSLGVAVFPDDGSRANDLLAVADARMFERKRAKKQGAAMFDCSVCKPEVETGVQF